MNITHKHPEYRERWKHLTTGRYNGAFYYSKLITEKIMPRVKTDRPWVTVNIGRAEDNAIVFIHNNKNPERYEFLKQYKNLILVCITEETQKKVAHLGAAVYLPLSVDIKEIEKYKTTKTKNACYYGRRKKINYPGCKLPVNIDIISGLPREQALKQVAKYHKCAAVGLAAIEAKILGCEIIPYDPRYPDPEIWEILDVRDAAEILQTEIDLVDERNDHHEEDY